MNLRNYLLIFLIGFLGRVLPHPENITPFHVLCIFGGIYLPTRTAIYVQIVSFCCADMLIAFSSGFPIWGSWSFYTYTGTLGLVYLGAIIRKKNLPIRFALFGTVGFWLWTNLGVWLHSGLYQKTLEGFISCYIAAIPFLQRALLGDFVWFVTLCLLISSFIRNDSNILKLKII